MLQNSRKILYFSSSIWKKVSILKLNPIFRAGDKLVYTRSSVIPKIFVHNFVYIYNGHKWNKRNLTQWVIGFKFGELTWNRKIALYKAKQMRKKKLKKLKNLKK